MKTLTLTLGFFLTLVLSSLHGTLFSQNVYIPDSVFKSALVMDLGINTNADTNIQVSEAIAFTGTISLMEIGVYDLTGIEAFVNLTGLDCGANFLTFLNVSANTELQTLSCSMNQLTTLDVSNCPNLYYLSCGNNMLTSLNLFNNLGLQSLYCESNNLTNLDLSLNMSLIDLYCPNNQLTSLRVPSTGTLSSVFCDNNLLSCVDVSACPNLIYLNCSFNQLTSLNVKNGNNINFVTFMAISNLVPLCVQVDDVTYAMTTWTGYVDNFVTFNLDCGQPTASFTANDPVCFGTPVVFTDSSINTTTWNWSFGNGATSSVQSPAYTYPAAGNYNVTLQASNCYGFNSTSATIIQGVDIAGHVSYTGGNVTNGLALIYNYQPFYISFDTVQIQSLDAAGNYHFTNIPQGDYLIKIFADTLAYPTLIPTYFSSDWAWDSANVMTQLCAVNGTADITMIEQTGGGGGIGLLSGYVIEGAGFGRAPGDPVHGVDVKLGVTASNQIVNVTTTDLTGNFSFGNVPFGNYTIYVDIPGLERDSSYTITVDAANNQFNDLNYIVDSVSIYITPDIGLNDPLSMDNSFGIFPNPVKGNAMIQFALLSDARVTLDIYNIMGIKVQSLVSGNASSGMNTFNFNPANYQLKSGVYFLALSAEGKTATKRIVILE